MLTGDHNHEDHLELCRLLPIIKKFTGSRGKLKCMKHFRNSELLDLLFGLHKRQLWNGCFKVFRSFGL